MYQNSPPQTVHATNTTVLNTNTHHKLLQHQFSTLCTKTTSKTQQNAQLNITKLLTSIYQITIIIYRKTIKLYQITINALYDVLSTLQG